jgi:hypothetical protein
MKFIRKEFIVTTVFDKELTERDEILIVLKNLLAERVDFSMTIKKYMPQQQDYFSINFEKVRVKKVYEEDYTVDLLAFKKGVKTSMKKASIDLIVSVEAITKKYRIMDVVSDIDRFDILDL